jgi:hypothetical protein
MAVAGADADRRAEEGGPVTTDLVRRTRTAVAVPAEPEPTNEQVRTVMPLSVGLAGTAGIFGLLALWSWLYAGRTGQAQILSGVMALLLLAAFYERTHERR